MSLGNGSLILQLPT